MNKQQWESQGMMQQPQIDAEADKMATAYEARLAEVKAAEARGEVVTLGEGRHPEELWGHGPGGLSQEERILQAQEAEKAERKARWRR